jgi:membrane protein
MRGKLDNPVLIAGLGIAGLLLGGYKPPPDRRSAAADRDPGPGARSGTRSGAKSGAKSGAGSGAESGGMERGHGATQPSEIPARGWWDIIKRVVAQVSADRLLTEAAGVTFFSLLAIFPALAALISIYGLFANPQTVSDHLASLDGIMPGGGMDILKEQVKALTSGPPKALGFGVVFGFATSLWSANQGIKALFDALNVVNDEKETRSFVRRTLITLAFTFGALVFVMVAMTAVVLLPAVFAFIGLSSVVEWLLRIGRWPLLLAAITFFLALVYRFGPSRERPKWRWVSWGGAFAAVAWVVGSAAFSWYVSNFGSYNKTYGSLGAVVGFMTWIWISTIIVLVGGELNAEMEHQTARDTTTGPEVEPGRRGAVKADRVAA